MARRKASSSVAKRITVAIPVAEGDLGGVLDSLARQSASTEDWELLLVRDRNRPAQAKARRADALAAKLTEIEIDGPASFLAAAAQAAGTPLVAFLAADASAEARWIETLRDTFDSHGRAVFAVAGRLDPIWRHSRPAWLDETLVDYGSFVNHGPAMQPLRIGQRVAIGNLAIRRDQFRRLEAFEGQLSRAAAAGLNGVEDAALITRDAQASDGLAIWRPEAVVRRPVRADQFTQGWLRRRAAWQAAMDLEIGPQPDEETVARRWRSAKRYLIGRPPMERTLRGLVLPDRDPKQFRLQVNAVYDSVFGLVAGIRELVDE